LLNPEGEIVMKTSTASIRSVDLRRGALIAFATGAVALACAGAHAADPEQIDVITVSAPAIKNVGVDDQTGAPLVAASVAARVQFDPVTLTTNSGVALLRDGVLEAAGKACNAVLAEDYGTCVRNAVAATESQVVAAVAQARTAAPFRG
jgi:hypothetical protein